MQGTSKIAKTLKQSFAEILTTARVVRRAAQISRQKKNK